MWTQPSQPAEGAERHLDFTVFCPVEKSLLAIIRRFILSVAEEMGFADEDIFKIEMAVDEACANVAQHAYGGGGTSTAGDGAPHPTGLELRLNLDPEGLTIHIQDHGHGSLTGRLHGAPSIEAYQQPGQDHYRGLGLLIMQQFMDEVDIQVRPETGVTVKMRKCLRTPLAG